MDIEDFLQFLARNKLNLLTGTFKALYQTEIMPDLDKVVRAMNNPSHELVTTEPDRNKDNQSADACKTETQSGEAAGTQSADKVMTQSKESRIVVPEVHDDSLRHPSEVLIEFKDCLKNLVLRGWTLPDERIYSVLQETKQVLEHRQDILPTVHRSFTQLTVELVITLLAQQPSSYTIQLLDTCIQLWKTCLNDPASLSMLFSGRIVLIINSGNTVEFAWSEYTKLLVMLNKEGVIKASQIQETGLSFLPSIQNEELLIRLCHCLCAFCKTLPPDERTESLGSCLELMYNMLPSNSQKEADMILQVLGVVDNRNSNLESCEEQHIDQSEGVFTENTENVEDIDKKDPGNNRKKHTARRGNKGTNSIHKSIIDNKMIGVESDLRKCVIEGSGNMINCDMQKRNVCSVNSSENDMNQMNV